VTPGTYPCPLPDGGLSRELVLSFDSARTQRVIILPALFDEANKLRRLTVEVMRRLDAAGIDCFLPDLPGTNESLIPLSAMTLAAWRDAALAAALHVKATRLLALRGGALIAPAELAGWHYAPAKGPSILRQMLRAEILAAREAGREETQDSLLAIGLQSGLELGGYQIGAAMLAELQDAQPDLAPGTTLIEQDMLDGGPLWLRAEPDDDRAQADALAAIISIGLAA